MDIMKQPIYIDYENPADNSPINTENISALRLVWQCI